MTQMNDGRPAPDASPGTCAGSAPARCGVIMLTETRSGSSWLGSLYSLAGMGRLGEWLSPGILGKRMADHDAVEWSEMALDQASANGHFHLKLFPRHLYMMREQYGVDVLRYCLDRHRTHLVQLRRRDRLRQAISLARGQQSLRWRSDFPARGAESYDYELICRCLFHISRSYAFRDALLEALALDARTFHYEDLLEDQSPYMEHMAALLGAPPPPPRTSGLANQRDARTEEWFERFRADARRQGVLDYASDRTMTLPPAWPLPGA